MVMYFSYNAIALDFTDFWCEFMMILAALGQVLIFGWIIGDRRGVDEANRGERLLELAPGHGARVQPVE